MAKPTFRALAQRGSRELLEAITLDIPEPPEGHDVDVDVMTCSVCHSDVHLLDGDWGDVARPLVPGHEIVGRVTRAGDRANLAEGAVVGIGWQAGSCGACAACRTEREHLCTGGKVRTCVGRAGGFADRVRVDARFCFEILAFDPDASKRDLVLSLGATELVDAGGALPPAAVDLLLVTTHAPLVWNDWLCVLDLEGTMCLVGVSGAPLLISADPLMDEQKRVTGSVIGSPAAMRRMLALAARDGIAPIVEHLPLARANEAITRVRDGAARMRVVLDVES